MFIWTLKDIIVAGLFVCLFGTLVVVEGLKRLSVWRRRRARAEERSTK